MKILIIGLGSIAHKHINAIRNNGNHEVFAFRSSNKSLNVDGVTNIYSWEHAKQVEADFALVSNPTAAHGATIQKLIELQIPMFIEKPLFSSVGAEESKILQQIEYNNIPTYVACNLRFLECLQFIRKKLKEERINEVNIYCGSYLPSWRPDIDYRKVYSANKELGGGVHIDLIHELDYAYWIYGQPSKRSSVFTNSSSLQISAYDYANYTWQYSNFNISIILNYYRRIARRTMEVVCDSGTYEVDLLANKVYFEGELIFKSKQTMLETYQAQMNYFIHNVVKNKSNLNDVFEAYKILELCIRD